MAETKKEGYVNGTGKAAYLTAEQNAEIDRYIKAVARLYSKMGHPKSIDEFYKIANPRLIEESKEKAMSLWYEAGKLKKLLRGKKEVAAIRKKLDEIEKKMEEIALHV